MLIGGPGADILDGGTGDNVVLDSAAANTVTVGDIAGTKWLAKNARTSRGKTVLKVDGESRTLPRAKLPVLARNLAK